MKENCPDCGTGIGMPHQEECDIERCTVCGCQRIGCECDGHDALRSAWTGFFPLRKNFELSLKLSKDKRIRAKPQQCWYNAFKTLFYCPEFEKANYVEGIVVDGVAIEHGWIEADGEIVDPTLPDDDLIYFPGLRFEGMRKLSEAMNLPKPDWCEEVPIFYRFGWGGRESPEYQSAWKAAMQFVNQQIQLRASSQDLHLSEGQKYQSV